MYLALPEAHALAGNSAVAWREVQSDRFIVSTFGLGPEFQDYLVKRISKIGFRPDIQRHRVGRDNLISMVGKGFGLTVTTEATLATKFPGVVLRSINGDNEVIPFSAIWSRRNVNPVLRRFLSFARSTSSRQNER